MKAGICANYWVCRQLTTREESFNVTVGETNGSVSIWKLLLAGAIGKQHTPATV